MKTITLMIDILLTLIASMLLAALFVAAVIQESLKLCPM